MKNYKYLFCLIIMLFYNKNSIAKTSGNYLTLDLISSYLNFSPIASYKDSNEIIHSSYTNSTNKLSYGFKYNLAINYKDFFISPGLIYEFNNINNYLNKSSITYFESIDGFGINFVKVKKRFGIKLDIGYDFNENISPYITAGSALNYVQSYGGNNYLFHYYDPIYNDTFINEYPFTIINKRIIAPFFGAGMKVKINNNLFLDLEYNFTKFKINRNNKYIEPYDSEKASNYKVPNDVDFNVFMNIFKMGISYNF